MSCDSTKQQVKGAKLPEGFCAYVIDDTIDRPRGIHVTETNDILILERGKNRVVLLVDDNDDFVAEDVIVIASAPGLNHGLVVHDGYLYASSSSTVYRWSYDEGQRFESTDMEVVIKNINAQSCADCGAPEGHSIRSLVVHEGLLYVSVGSVSNVDVDSYRSRIRRFNISSLPEGGYNFDSGEVFADGLRNEVGLAFDRHGVLWGVENGADNLYRADLGGDIHNDNPAEELNRFPESNSGKHYGYPYCFTEYKLPDSISLGRGSRWAWPSFIDSGYTDQWCRNSTLPASMAMQAHSAPLGITFIENKTLPSFCVDSFSNSMIGEAIIGFHGSWNRDIPVGYKVVRVPMSSGGDVATNQPLDFFCYSGKSAKWPSGLRPVDVKFDVCNRMLVTSDGTKSLLGTYYGSMVIMIVNTNIEMLASPQAIQCSTGDIFPWYYVALISAASILTLATLAIMVLRGRRKTLLSRK